MSAAMTSYQNQMMRPGSTQYQAPTPFIADGNACGGVCTDSTSGDPALIFVGKSRGAYVKTETYEYVGEGEGDYDTVMLPERRRGCLYMCGCFTLAAIIAAIVAVMIFAPSFPFLTSANFHCNRGLESDWIPAKREYCCKEAGKGCPLYDCAAGFDTWQTGWSEAKKVWCCQNDNLKRGCADDSAGPFDCDAGFSNWVLGWSAPKKVYCCQAEGRGCTGSTFTTTAPLFDCDAGFENWENGWSPAKIEYCCETRGRGCSTTTTLFDCNAAFNNWVEAWSVAKKAWCCQHASRGCLSTPNP